jgi:endonuclease/exonuclease/phosphatase family metal-dependent hydrolase
LSSFKIITINILVDPSRWKQRRDLLVQGLANLQPDLVALQEVRLPDDPAHWLAEQLGLPHVHLSPKMGFEASREAIAVLSRLPFENKSTLDLQGQQRVAQYVSILDGSQPLIFVNTHLFWQPGNSAERLRQTGRMLHWLQQVPGSPPIVICGDFNATPETTAIALMRQHYTSAYLSVHGHEPEYTCPTPLPRSTWSNLRTLLGFFLLLRPQSLKLNWRGTLDYIFVDRRLKISDCRVILNQPSPSDPRIYPSDHFGLFAKIER